MKKAVFLRIMLTAAALALLLSGCRFVRVEEEERKPVDYTVVEMQALGHHKKIRYITRTTCTACILLGSLCTTVFYFGGNFAGTILFHNTDAGLYIRTLSFICPFLYTNIALTSILNGLGKTGTTLVHSVLGILLRISFVIFAIPVLGIRGYLYGLLLSEILLSLLHIYALYHMEF